MTANFGRVDSARTWTDYQTPTAAHMTAFELCGYKLVSWKPHNVQLVSAGSSKRYVNGKPDMSPADWMNHIRLVEQHNVARTTSDIANPARRSKL
jgi:hypothetical protein